ncbi:hypothetical protein [Mahella australiensis]|uniref:Uncharacterized protein n=1 Tax=Mahella australiensis (strain DSM 15567 / CIP 107919 / 50-1 BON) TaxID=697281 RepID=F3ZZE3_MAHA5|nr:hypothetical protein [Mahella australiensis]AEE95753.1 hypothetical protein Mahau_0549 [Mahella australiensis 50-1 BON]
MLVMSKNKRILADITGAVLAVDECGDDQYYICIEPAGRDKEILGMYETYEDAVLMLTRIAEQAQNGANIVYL